jgi:hypothetical protein
MDPKQKKALDAVLEAANAVIDAAQQEYPEYTFVLVALNVDEKHVALTTTHPTGFVSLDRAGQEAMHRDFLVAAEALDESLVAMEATMQRVPCACSDCRPPVVRAAGVVGAPTPTIARRAAVRIKVDGDSPGEIIDDVVIDDSFVQRRPPGRLKN